MTSSPGTWVLFLSSALWFLMCLAGIVLALLRWRRYPTPCALVLVGMVTMLVAHAIQLFGSRFVVTTQEPDSVTPALIALSLFTSLLNVAGIAALLGAAFSARDPIRTN